jgi:probable LLM family oxidoreductase
MTDHVTPKRPFELGLLSFVEWTAHPQSNHKISSTERIANLIETAELADQVGLDVFALGEHHREEYLSSAPEVLLSAIATRTHRIRLSSGVTVLSSDDPVRVFQRFATLDLVSAGRAEIIAGRGSFIESFPLFGYDLRHYDDLFSEKLELLLKLRDEEIITWQGQHRPTLDALGVYPRPHQQRLPIWIGVGGTPQSVVRAGLLGLPLAIAIIGGMPERFAPLVKLYWQAVDQAGHDRSQLSVSINSHGFIADTYPEAMKEAFPAFKQIMDKIGRERGWQPMSRNHFEQSATLRGADFIGTPDQIIEKILFQHSFFHHDRLLLQLSVGSIPHDKMMRAIELLGTKVAPAVRQEIAKRMTQVQPS